MEIIFAGASALLFFIGHMLATHEMWTSILYAHALYCALASVCIAVGNKKRGS